MTEPEIRAIAKLELKPGDAMVCFVPKEKLTGAVSQNITRTHMHLFGPSIKLILTDDEFRFGVLTGGKEL